MRQFINWICNRYKQYVYDWLISDFYGSIPDSTKLPSIDFLVNGKEKLERFFSIQAYTMQRRSIMDDKNVEVYKGILIHIRSLLALISSSEKPKPGSIDTSIEVEKKIDEDVDGVQDFLKKGKEMFLPKE